MMFWLYMLAMSALTPLAMLVLGRRFMQGGPERMHGAFGYRTRRSMQSREAWDFAHRHAGRRWWAWGWVLLAAACCVFWALTGREAAVIGAAGAVVTGAELAVWLSTCISTEQALKRRFDAPAPGAGRP